MAEGILRQMCVEQGLDWKIESAGTNGYHTGEAPHRMSQKVCLENNIDIRSQRSRDFQPKDFDTYDMIYVMASDVYLDIKRMSGSKFREDKIDFFLNPLYPKQNRNVKDPWYGGDDGYYAVYEEIKRGCSAIIHHGLKNT